MLADNRLSKGRPPLPSVMPPLLAVRLAVGDNPFRAPRCKRLNKLNTTIAVSRSIPLLPSSAIAVYIAAPSSSYCSCTLPATDATFSHEVTAQSQLTLFLPSSSSTVTATLGCHPPLRDFTLVVPTLLLFTAFNLKIAATLFRRLAKGLCWHCNKLWSRDHHYKKERPLLVEPTEEPKLKDMTLESEEKDMKEKSQSVARTFHAPPQILDIDGFIKHQLITILVDTRSSNDLMNDKRKQVTLCGKGENEEKMISTQCLEKLTEISGTSVELSRLLSTRLHDPCMLVLQGEPPAHIRPYCCLYFQRTEAKKLVQEMQDIRIIRPQPSLAMTFYLQ
ncbi:hypothetical protein GW17_00044393 [Ensete ventricosum]|nr:hypothetical protein GW17_00044393 [Ensete ventricosum]